MLLPTLPSFRPMGMVGEACLPSNAYYPRTPDYTFYSGVLVCRSERSDSSFDYGFMSLDYGYGTMTTTANFFHCPFLRSFITFSPNPGEADFRIMRTVDSGEGVRNGILKTFRTIERTHSLFISPEYPTK